LPFILLLSRTIKRSPRGLTLLALLIFLGRAVDLYWLMVPAFYPEGFHFHWLALALWFAIGGGWMTVFIWQWQGKDALPRHDPHLGESYEKHEEFVPAEQTG
jgi:hypothetical protein